MAGCIDSLTTAVDWLVSFTLHEPITCRVSEKGFSEGEKRDFPILTVLVPISQGAEVTKVTKYVLLLNIANWFVLQYNFHNIYNLLHFLILLFSLFPTAANEPEGSHIHRKKLPPF